MKFDSAIKRLSRFGFLVDEKGSYFFWSRNNERANRQVKVINQDGKAIILPMFVDGNKKEGDVVFHCKTIKAAEAFLMGE
jgi:hypothetical protein